MQTKTDIQKLLAQVGVEPNRRLGQHFLIDLNLMRLLVDAAEIQKDDVVLEVGCGTGSLTAALAEKAGRVIAVEHDKNLVEIAKKQLTKFKNIDLFNADILEKKHILNRSITEVLSLARKDCTGRFLLVANLPYNVASPVMINLIVGSVVVDAMYVTVQKEVAERITAWPGGKNYGTLSIFLSAAGNVKIIRILKPSVFWPKPKVDSAMVSFILNREKYERIKDMNLFCEIVHMFMSHPRKTILSCSKLLRGKSINNWPAIFNRCGLNPTKRPQQLSPEEYITLSKNTVR